MLGLLGVQLCRHSRTMHNPISKSSISLRPGEAGGVFTRSEMPNKNSKGLFTPVIFAAAGVDTSELKDLND